MNRNAIPHNPRLSTFLENTIPHFTPSDLHHVLPPLHRNLKHLLNSRFSVYSSFSDLGKEVGDGLSDRFYESVDDG